MINHLGRGDTPTAVGGSFDLPWLDDLTYIEGSRWIGEPLEIQGHQIMALGQGMGMRAEEHEVIGWERR